MADIRAGKTVHVECITPIFRVSNLQASIRYYVDSLGFTLEWGGEDGSSMASVSRDRHSIMLCDNDQGQPGTWLWIGVEDVEALYREYSAAGLKIVKPPTNFPWAYEIRIEDPDGHILRFGSEPKSDQPFAESFY